MTTENTTRNDSLAARTIPGCSRCWSGHPDSGISSRRGTGADGTGPCKPHSASGPDWMFLAGRGAFPLFALVWGLNCPAMRISGRWPLTGCGDGQYCPVLVLSGRLSLV